LFGVRPGEPGVVAPVIALLLAAAVVASWLPARRIANIAPSDGLRRT
jgi:ABC-type lipoprotein release transport system permease subunit